MNSNGVRSLIRSAIEHEEKTGTVAQLLSQHLSRGGVSLTDHQKAEMLAFLAAYVRETPDIMDAAYHAAQQAGVLESMQPIFDAAFHYWAEPYDYIPDNLGLIGLTDDAYLTRMFLETISGLHQQQTGGPLLAIDLGPPNRVMRGLIGEPVATQLDAAVGQTVASQLIQAGLHQLAVFTGGLNFDMPGFNGSTYTDIQHLVDVQLGAMGVI